MAYKTTVLSADQALEPTRGIEYIVPFPYSSNIRNESGKLKPTLSVLSTMAIDAAVETWKVHPTAHIVIPGESPFGSPDTSDLMAQRALATSDISPDFLIPLHSLSDGRGLNNTYLQSQGLSEFLGSHSNQENTLTLALDYHIGRVQRALHVFGFASSFVTVEDVLHARGITGYDRYLPVIDGLKRTELLARLLTNGLGLPKGQIPNALMTKTGPRIVDVVEQGDGSLQLEQDYARKKYGRLTRQLAK